MNQHTTRWLLAPRLQLRTRRLMAQHGPTLPYSTAWALITLHNDPHDTYCIRQWTKQSPQPAPGVHYDRWQDISSEEQRRRRQWLRHHGYSPIQLLRLDAALIKDTGLHVLDWGPPTP